MGADTGEQMRAIEEVLAFAAGLGIEIWLRGGWAMDFFPGRVTRAHIDVDWFIRADDIDELSDALVSAGFEEVTAVDRDQQRDLVRGPVEHGFALLKVETAYHAVVAGGPWGGEPWPAGMLPGCTGRIGDIEAPIIDPEAQIEIKEMTPVWNPALPVRQKDLDDIAAIQAVLG